MNTKEPSKQLTAVSLFSGCGGFDWGAKQAGVNIIWANDIDPNAARAYRAAFPQVEFHEGDVRDIKQFPSADILIGCYPCTGFSEAAKRRWSGRERDLFENHGNFLYREFLRALREIRPKFLFVENVRGMLSAEAGWFFERQLKGFKKHGYNISNQLLNAHEFGVPQLRKRLFIVGIRDDLEFGYRFPEPTHGPGKMPFVTLRDTLEGMDEWPTGEFNESAFHGHYLTRNRKKSWDDPSFTIVAHEDHVPLHPIGKPMKKLGKDLWCLQGVKNRRLSWKECRRIQGLPETVAPSDFLLNNYKVVGNAVPPKFGEVLLRPIVRKFGREG